MAKFIKDLTGFNGIAKLWMLNNGQHVVTSYVREALVHETMAFKADKNGEVTDWGDLACRRNAEAHNELIAELEDIDSVAS